MGSTSTGYFIFPYISLILYSRTALLLVSPGLVGPPPNMSIVYYWLWVLTIGSWVKVGLIS